MNKLKNFGRAALASAFISIAAPAGAVTVSGDFLVDAVNVGVVTAGIDNTTTDVSLNQVFSSEIFGNASDGAGSIAFSFTATEKLTTFETNSLNPNLGFADATIEWNSASDGSGTSFGSLTTAQVVAGDTLAVGFLANEIKWLIASWSNVTANGSNFDLRVAAVPLPPAALLFGSALVGLGFMARRRRRKQGSVAA